MSLDRWKTGRALLASALCLGALTMARAQAQTFPPIASAADAPPISHGLFSDIRIERPAGTPRQFVLLVTHDATPTAHEKQMARTLVEAGAMVALVPLAPFERKLEAQDGKCTFTPGAFENLSRHLQAFEHLPTYLLPMLVGADDEASYVYAVLAQASAGTFASGLSAGFCPRFEEHVPPCAAGALHWQAGAASGVVALTPATAALTSPWIAIQAASSAACTPASARAFVQAVPKAEWSALTVPESPAEAAVAFDKAYRKLAVSQVALAPPPTQLADLPLVELPVAGNAGPNGSRLAVLLSGDGGWAGIDKSLAAALVAQGVAVAGVDSLRYFWSARTPEQLAVDVDRVIRYYAARWGRSDVLLVGYSQGADVLPFAINRLPAATRATVRLAALLGPGQKASFEFHLSNWMGPSGDLPIAPEALKLSAASTLCIYGAAEKDSLCPELSPDHARAVALAGGHHFSGDYAGLAARILDAAPR